MTIEDLYEELKELRKEMARGHEKQADELKELRKEFYIFKGRAMQFLSVASVFFALGIDYVKKKMGI